MFLWLVLSTLLVISIIVVGLASFVVFIDSIVHYSDIDSDLWKE